MIVLLLGILGLQLLAAFIWTMVELECGENVVAGLFLIVIEVIALYAGIQVVQ